MPDAKTSAAGSRTGQLGVPDPAVALFALAVGGLAAGAVARWSGHERAAEILWALVTAGALVPAVWWVVDGLRHRRFGPRFLALSQGQLAGRDAQAASEPFSTSRPHRLASGFSPSNRAFAPGVRGPCPPAA